MRGLTETGRFLFGVAMGLFGVLCLVFASGRRWPVIGPPWTLGSLSAGWLIGIGLIAAAACIVAGWRLRLVADLLGVGILLRALIVESPAIFKHPHNPGGWTVVFELVAMASGALVLAGVAAGANGLRRPEGRVGRYLFAVSLVVFGVQHFMYGNFIAGLITAWIPWHFFWAEFVGVVFVCAAASLVTGVMGRVGMGLLGVMFLSWVLVLHGPRILASPHNGNEWTSGIVALAMGGASWVMAGMLGD